MALSFQPDIRTCQAAARLTQSNVLVIQLWWSRDKWLVHWILMIVAIQYCKSTSIWTSINYSSISGEQFFGYLLNITYVLLYKTFVLLYISLGRGSTKHPYANYMDESKTLHKGIIWWLDKEAYLDKFKTCVRAWPIESQVLDGSFYEREHT